MSVSRGAYWRLLLMRKVFVGALLLCFCTAVYLGTSSLPLSSTSKDKTPRLPPDPRFPHPGSLNKKFSKPLSGLGNSVDSDPSHCLLVIVPFRDRFEELLVFAPHLHNFLDAQAVTHKIIVVNQVDLYRFNRAGLINAGFLWGRSNWRGCDYVAMHDVDLLPLNSQLSYKFPGTGNVMHLAAPGLHPRYDYPNFIGGVLLVTVEDFLKVNGMSNIYWGWGMEDDEFYVRLKHNNVTVIRPTGLDTGKKDTFRHIHSAKLRPRDHQKCFDQLSKTRRRDRLTGLQNLNHTVLSSVQLTVENAALTVLNVKLHCDLQISPWCDCSGQNPPQQQPKKPMAKRKLAQNV